jgi:hypothetical protein
MKRAVAFILMILLFVCAVLPIMAEQSPIVSNNPIKIKAYDPTTDSQKSAHQVHPGEVYGAHLNLGAAFNGLAYCLPTWSTTDSDATLALYAWNETYDKTVAAEPIAQARFENVRDCQTYTLSFDEQPAGEYLFCIKDAEGSVGTWLYPAKISKGYVVQDGAEKTGDLEITVSFTQTPETPFYQASSQDQAYTGHATPDEYVFPEEKSMFVKNLGWTELGKKLPKMYKNHPYFNF